MSQIRLKIAFAGTPDIAADVLSSLIEAGHEVVVCYCQPDRKVGRGKKITIGPVKQVALDNNIPVEQPIKFDQSTNEFELTPVQQLASYNADLMIVIAYGLLLPLPVLDTPRFGCINIHASLLPRWRGAAPIQRAIESGDSQTGITIMQMDKGLDTGNMLLKKTLSISSEETGSSLHDKLAILGSESIIQYIDSVNWRDECNRRSSDYDSNGECLVGERQNNALSNYAKKLTKSEALVDWSLTGTEIEKKIRAFNSWPVSYTYLNKQRIRLWKARLSSDSDIKILTQKDPSDLTVGAVFVKDKQTIKVICGNGELIEILQLQADGSKRMLVSEFLNGKSHWFDSDAQFSEL